ncbi:MULTISPECIES: PAS domain-containing sensor histidine kinase [unclassified Bosea (in: a-proteobacteria)]|uniref:sensor histidine kinase n=1 Tax=unclassified Bosea (in: a-proteobacteria) TaxID=2653178 RepID=UPI000F74F5B0|nr:MULTISPECIES: PAS domain-containing sensor histidine kinase [unclassified Bosea (in: a-proteobacteria)]AZO81996.1 PAS domain-containing sensor histidine kinase [Bosea sp. Tri-49]RXT16684.1 PAS domain-containing sensor histidine kinase [Bosea sp. Tri-39]RXT42395.1 PAS domain-containing sensor histidine kinase [Bosea sp. Tri-54]
MTASEPRRDQLVDFFDNAPCGYLSIASTGEIVLANRTLATWLGHDAAALSGKRLYDVLPFTGRVYWETHLRPLLKIQGNIDGVALDFLSAAGETIPCFASAVESAGDAPTVKLAIFKAAERRQFEQSLLKARAAAQENLRSERATAELREQFIAVLGHDLRNPLAGFAGGVRLLARENLSEKGAKILPLLMGSIARMSELIDNVMDFAKARLGDGITLDRNAAEPLTPALQQVVDELTSTYPDRRIELQFAIAEPVDCDRARIAQLVSNLLGNALAHGAVDQPIRMRAQTAEGFLHVSIANGGDPIPPEAMAKLFQPFFRGEVRANLQGLGLGLHIASEIAKAHGGTIVVDSSELETQFTFRMPLG